jgi:hypothetical protein
MRDDLLEKMVGLVNHGDSHFVVPTVEHVRLQACIRLEPAKP